MKQPLRTALRITAAASLLAAASAQAVDWGGYLRAGPGATKKDASRACYSLGGEGLKYRLGNECDFYGEFALSQGFKADGVDYKATLMTNLWEGNTNGDTSKLGINQMYVEGKGYDIAPDTTFWAGKRFHGRTDVHIVDTFYVNLSGVGAGFDSPVGNGKLAVSYFKNDETATKSGNRLNVDFYDVGVNPGGKLRVVATATQANFTGGKSGFALTLQHNQDNLFGLGGGNTLWVQYAQGSAWLNGNFGNLSAPSGQKSFRIVESLTWQQGPFGGQAQALWQQDKNDAAGSKLDSATVGGRASYALTKNFKLVSELGYSQKKPEGQATAKLTKFTFAPTLSTGPGFWNRPELRLYVTTAKWNSAANAQAAAASVDPVTGNPTTDNIVGVPAFSGKTSGTSFGAQVEMWF
jgi:maltoporin